MTRKMIINAIDPEEVRIAILGGRTLEDFDIETRGVEKNKGNIYKGQVMAVEPALNAAFINYGPEKQGFLTANDVHPKYAHNKKGIEAERHERTERNYRITDLLKPKQTVLVQVAKDEVSSKGAVLTTYLSLAGRYLVLMPDSDTQGVSRKIDDEQTRQRVREAAAKLNVPSNMGVIIRTAGKDRTRIELNRDLRVLLRLWDNILTRSNNAKAPALIFKEQDVIIRALRDYFSADIDEIVLDADDAYDRAAEYMHMVMPNQTSVLSRYVERRPIFHHYRIEEQLEQIYTPKVILPSGGSIVIEPTEALVAIDVNSGKQKSGNQEETATETNVQAAREVARQLRLRDLGGIVVVDFIDMAARKNQQRVERALKEALKDDKARVKIGRISRNGTLEVTRQRIRSALGASVFDRCHACHGTGHVLNPESHALAVMRRLRDRASRGDLIAVKVRVEPEVANRLRTDYWTALKDIEKRNDVRVDIQVEHSFVCGQDDFAFETNPHAKVSPLSEPNFGAAPRLDEDDAQAPDKANIWALEDMDQDELRELEALDRDDAKRAQLLKHTDVDESDEGEFLALGRKKRRRKTNARKEGLPAAAGALGKSRLMERTLHIDSLEETLGMPRFEMLDPAFLPRPRHSYRTGADNTRQHARNEGRGQPRQRRQERTIPPHQIMNAAEALRGTMQAPTAPTTTKGGDTPSLWRRLWKVLIH